MPLSPTYSAKDWEEIIYHKWASTGVGSPKQQISTSQKPKLLFATTNNHKIRLFKIAWQKQALDQDFELLTLRDLPDDIKNSLPEVEENTNSFTGDALLKAQAYSNFTGLPTISQDRGFVFTALNWPGTDSKKEIFGDDKKVFNNSTWYDDLQAHIARSKKLLTRIDGLDRGIEVIQGLAVALPGGKSLTEKRINYGVAADSIDENIVMNGGGYDWFFVPNGLGHVLSVFPNKEILEEYSAINLYPITSGIVNFLYKNLIAESQTYSVIIPPPNLTGVLHAGHALEHTIMDTIARIQRQKGQRTLYYPGVDHAGIQLEGVIAKLITKGEFDSKLKEI